MTCGSGYMEIRSLQLTLYSLDLVLKLHLSKASLSVHVVRCELSPFMTRRADVDNPTITTPTSGIQYDRE